MTDIVASKTEVEKTRAEVRSSQLVKMTPAEIKTWVQNATTAQLKEAIAFLLLDAKYRIQS